MRRRPLGRTGETISACGLGCMMFGSQLDKAASAAQMEYALERGVDFFDTAEFYSIPPQPDTQGESERLIGEWFSETGRRDEVFLASKINGRAPLPWFREGGEDTRLTEAQIDFAVENSLKRLKTDRIDLYQIHWPDRDVWAFGPKYFKPYDGDFEPFEDILGRLARHVEKGNIRHIGLSNETPWGLMRFLQESERRGLPRIVTIQNLFNMTCRIFEYGLAEMALQEDVGLLAYSPIGQGFLTGKYLGGVNPEGSRKRRYDRMQRYETPSADAAIGRYVDLARANDIDPAQMAVRFCDTRPFTASTIIGASSMAQLKTALDAFDLDWTDDLETRVNAIHIDTPNPVT